MTQEKPRSGAHTGGSEGPLDEKVAAWLQKEGYPLEFDTARAFQRAGFTVLQSEYTEPRPDRPRREVDVVAHISQRNEQLLRAEHVIECKWSGDKPWVFFCGGGGMTTAARRSSLWTVAAAATQPVTKQTAKTVRRPGPVTTS